MRNSLSRTLFSKTSPLARGGRGVHPFNWEKIPVSLDKELEQITASSETEKRYVDKLYQVWLLDGHDVWILIHIEVQSQYDKDFSQKMFIYNYRAFDLYHKEVISLAILGDERKNWRPNYFGYGKGNSQLKFTFSIVKLLDYKWEELEQNQNIFAIVVMAHLKTKFTGKNLTEREQWKWTLSRLLYEKGYTRKHIVDLYKLIDLMMSLPPELQLNFEEKLTQYQEERKMPLLTNIEQRALVKGQEIGAKETRKQDIINLLESRFNTLPEKLVNSIKNIEDLSVLKYLLIQTIKVNSVTEFEQLINENLPNTNNL